MLEGESLGPAGPGLRKSHWSWSHSACLPGLDVVFASSARTLDRESPRDGLLFGQGVRCFQCF